MGEVVVDAVVDGELLVVGVTAADCDADGEPVEETVGASVGGIGGADVDGVGVPDTEGVRVAVWEVAVTVAAALRVDVAVSPYATIGSIVVVDDGVAKADAVEVRERKGEIERREVADRVRVGIADCVTESDGDAVSVG